MARLLVFAGCITVSLLATPALAWHEVGHMLTMLVAYKQLSPGDTPSQAIQKLVAILKHHPRFDEDFARALPSGLSADAEARWLLCRASVWPDQIRIDHRNKPSYPPIPTKKGSYHRGNWHYIDTPLLIVAQGTSQAQVKDLEAKAKAAQDLATDAPAAEADVKNVLQAIAFNREKLAHGQPDEKAVALCWLLHTIADLHQPLHATSAFSLQVFDPTNSPHGDAGGNAIHLADKQNLHAVWDDAPDASPDLSFNRAESFDQRYHRAYDRALKQCDLLLADNGLAAQGKLAAGENNPNRWAQESYDLAKVDAYTAEIRKRIVAADRSTRENQKSVSVQLSDDYRAHAHEVGKLRVVQGGYRLAEFLNGL